jgi:K+-transporting ATPase KdpF subunit
LQQVQLFFPYFPRGVADGHKLFDSDGGLFCGDRFADYGLRIVKGAIMSWLYLLSGSLAVAVFVYLVVALFYPEKF